MESHCQLYGILSRFLKKLPGIKAQEAKITILKNVSGIIKPSRMTLLLGPPGCGKSTLLLALAGKLDKALKAAGEVTYNGFQLEEFVPQKTAAYISQYDVHIPEMTVRETLDFSARFQGVGNRAEIMREVIRREKQAGLNPEPDIDAYMKAISLEGLERSLQTDYIMKIIGLDICGDTIVGDTMRRGISGGEKKRLTTGEMIVGPRKALFMDDISTGLDSSTTFQIVKYLQQLAHISEATLLVSLLQPAPETYELFDDIILMGEGKVIYHGPRGNILDFFDDCGFRCPERKGAADFLQEVLSKKDQEQYWSYTDKEYKYVSVDDFLRKFKAFHVGRNLDKELSHTCDLLQPDKSSLCFDIYTLPKWELLKACLAREYLLMKRNSFVYIFKTTQLVILAIIAMTLFIRTRMTVDLIHSNYYMGAIFYSLMLLMVNGFPELAMQVSRLPVFYKQRDIYFYPAWAYSIPAALSKLPISFVESLMWTCLTYYVIGYSPEVKRFIFQFFLLFALHQTSLSLFRLTTAVFKTIVAAWIMGVLCLVVFLLFGGFILPRPSLPGWIRWGFWISPLTYAEIGLTIDEFLAPRWKKRLAGNTTISHLVLKARGLDYPAYFYWISLAALVGFALLFNIGFTMALAYLRPPGRSLAIISREKLLELQKDENRNNLIKTSTSKEGIKEAGKTGKLALPFAPLTISFRDIQYYVDTPTELREQGYTEKRLQLLHDITGAFKPGILTAIMGVSGAGKTTLMDVLSGRKTGGNIEGDIRINGYPKKQDTFARISGYCEQTDIHSPQITVEESVRYSASLRLPPEIDAATRTKFVNEVLEAIELDEIKDALVGLPGISGLSTEQRKRLTIAVELVSNPSIIFMDEPTSGLDARAAAIVMRTVKNVAETGRTVVCTIHQPTIDIFEAFDELLLMKRGGRLIYSGPLGNHSSEVIKYFEDIQEVPKIKDNYNPGTWVLEVTTPSIEMQLDLNFTNLYKESSLCRNNVKLVYLLSTPPLGTTDLHFPSRFSQSNWSQFKSCLWKHFLSYWRSPSYNLVRIFFMTTLSIMFASVFWQHRKHINSQQDLSNILASMFLFVVFTGINNCSSVLPFVRTERSVLYREHFSGMYSPWVYTFAQMTVELPYIFFQVVIFMSIAYPAIGYYWTAKKFFWFFYIMFVTLLYFNYFGMMLVSLTPNSHVATILVSVFYSMVTLFSGFIIPKPQVPNWWIWMYHATPSSWTLNGLFTSQFGDVQQEVLIFGETKSIASFIKDYYGFRHDLLGVVAAVLLIYPLVFGSVFAYCIGKLNFQRR